MQTSPTRPLEPSASRARRRTTRRTVVRLIKRLLVAAIGAAILGLIVYAWLPKPVVVDVTRARRMPLAVEVDEDGQTRVRDRFVVSAPITGLLQRIELEPGATVTAGEPVARIDPPESTLLDPRSHDEANARLASAIAHQRRAESMVARAKAARDLAVREAERSRKLAETGAITASQREKSDLDAEIAVRDLAAAETERSSAIAEVAAARAVLGSGSTRGARPTVIVPAPTGGKVLKLNRDSAGPVLVGSPLLEIGDPSALEVVIDVLSSDAERIRPGMEVLLEGWGGEQPLHGRVRTVEPSAFTRISALGVEEQRVKIVADVDNPPASLGDGFRVDARIFTWRGDVVAVPASAVFRDRDHWAIYTIEDGHARLRTITIGHRGRLEIEVTGGLPEGAIVVIHPSDRVTNGARVEPR